MKPLLSFCIPTFNRAEYLRSCIDSLISQPEFSSGEVEIVISDNASTDATENIAREYAAKHENITYFRNDKNILDRNFPLCISRARGSYRKLSNDTLSYAPGSLAIYLDHVRKHITDRPSLFFYGSRFRRHSRTDDFVYRNADAFLRDASYLITWIATFGIWDSELPLLEDPEQGCSTRLWQVSALMKTLAARPGPVHVCASPLFSTQTFTEKKDMSYGIFEVFYKNFSSLLLPYIGSVISRRSVAKIKKDLLFGFFMDMLIDRRVYPARIIWNENENLEKAVFRAYRNENYFGLFLIMFHTRVTMKRIGKAWHHR